MSSPFCSKFRIKIKGMTCLLYETMKDFIINDNTDTSTNGYPFRGNNYSSSI